MRRTFAILSVVSALLLPALPAHASTPNGIGTCALGAGKVAAYTSTVTRSVNARWPGMNCPTVGKEMGTDAAMYVWNGKAYAVLYSIRINDVFNVSSVPADSVILHCPHRALVKVKIIYFRAAADNSSTHYWTNATICS